MRRSTIIRLELQRAEEACNQYWEIMQRTELADFWLDRALMCYTHFTGRRRFFLQDLLKHQLKEFNREV